MVDKQKVEQAIRLLLEGIGEDVNREGLLETPARVARMYEEIFGGFDEDAAVHLAKTFHA
ncbi:MAG: GTP cyclohydrolase I, partial [Lachnospiraceae bacterium]|nr:GTP cyclohydrolase I [Lachnospiraceae bacterium]